MRFRGVRYEQPAEPDAEMSDAIPADLNAAVARGIALAERKYRVKVYEYPYARADERFLAVVNLLAVADDGATIAYDTFNGASQESAYQAARDWVDGSVARALASRSVLLVDETIERTC